MSTSIKSGHQLHIWNRSLSTDELQSIKQLLENGIEPSDCDCCICSGQTTSGMSTGEWWTIGNPMLAFSSSDGWTFDGVSISP